MNMIPEHKNFKVPPYKTTRKEFEKKLKTIFPNVSRELDQELEGEDKRLLNLSVYYTNENKLNHVATWVDGEGWIF